MTSIRARLLDWLLPYVGIRRFFTKPAEMRDTLARMRADESPRPTKAVRRHIAISEESNRGYPLVTYAATDGASHIVYFHGGGYVLDINAVHWDAVARICRASGSGASIPVYPLAPERTVSETFPQMLELAREMIARHGAANVILGGDSAGAGMALAIAQALRDAGEALPAGVLLFSPWLDAGATGPDQPAIEPRDRMLGIDGLRECGRLYGGDVPLDDPRLSPLFASLDGLPPLAIFAGTHDVLISDARRLVARLEQVDGASFAFNEYQRMMHDWMLFPIPEGRKALAEAAQFVRTVTKGRQ